MARAHTIRDGLWRWAKLVLGLAVIWLFVFVVAPLFQRLGPVRAVHEKAGDRGIDATGLFYTDVAEFADAEMHVRNSIQRQR